MTEPLPALQVLPNAGGGDCLFHSVAQACNAYRGAAAADLNHHLAALHLIPAAVTAQQLRAMTYAVFLQPSPETDTILSKWVRMASGCDAELATEYGQARVLANKRVDRLTSQDRAELYMACMERAVCWGDETALNIMERLLRIRCIVLCDGRVQIRQHGGYPDGFTPIVFTALRLRGNHYEALGVDGVFAWTTDELPRALVRLVQRDCSAASAASFITLASGTDAIPAVADDPLTAHYARCVAGRAVMLRMLATGRQKRARRDDTAAVPADGGLVLEGVMSDTVVRLQCGSRTTDTSVFSSAAATMRPPVSPHAYYYAPRKAPV